MSASKKKPRQMKFSVFLSGDSNYHLAGWRHPKSYDDAGLNLKRWVEFAQTMERAKLDMLFVADTIGIAGMDNPEIVSRSPRASKFEPLTVLSALSTLTTHIGLAATAATTYNEPYTVARMFASLDHLSGGRAAWNVVTGGNKDDAFNFGREGHLASDSRYDRAEEFADVVLGLWDSFEDDAFVRDKATGRFFDPHKLHSLNHKGQHFSVRGPLSVARPPQGHPVVIQAGASDTAMKMAARIAEVMFTAHTALDDAKEFAARLRQYMAGFGRAPEDLKIMPGACVYVGRTKAEAEDRYDQLNALVRPDAAMKFLSNMMGGIDLSPYDPHGPVPDFPGNSARMAAPPAFTRLARREGLTLQQLALRAAGSKFHWCVKGTAKDICDQLQEWFESGAADGFNLLPAQMPGSLDDFAELVIPELQRRGLFRTEYEGRNLRENLGLARPQNAFTHAAARRATS